MRPMDETANREVYHTVDEILGHPAFGRSRRGYVDAILDLYEDDPFLNRLLIETGRSLTFFNILCLHAAYDEADRATWPTIRRLRATVAPYGVSSARRIHDLVARLIETGYVTAHTAPLDRRVRILTPSEKMLAHDRDWLAAFYTPLEIMFPDPGYAYAIRRDPAFQKAQRAVALQLSGLSAQFLKDNPVILFFMGREAGMMILMKLVQLSLQSPDGLAEFTSFADIGERFGVSRTHVRSLLREAERMDLVRIFDGGVRLMSVLLAAFDRFLADTMSGHDILYMKAAHNLEKLHEGGAQFGQASPPSL